MSYTTRLLNVMPVRHRIVLGGIVGFITLGSIVGSVSGRPVAQPQRPIAIVATPRAAGLAKEAMPALAPRQVRRQAQRPAPPEARIPTPEPTPTMAAPTPAPAPVVADAPVAAEPMLAAPTAAPERPHYGIPGVHEKPNGMSAPPAR